MTVESRVEHLDYDIWELEERLRSLEQRLSFLEKLVRGELLCESCGRPLLGDGVLVEVYAEGSWREVLCHSCFYMAAAGWRRHGWSWRIVDEWGAETAR